MLSNILYCRYRSTTKSCDKKPRTWLGRFRWRCWPVIGCVSNALRRRPERSWWTSCCRRSSSGWRNYWWRSTSEVCPTRWSRTRTSTRSTTWRGTWCVTTRATVTSVRRRPTCGDCARSENNSRNSCSTSRKTSECESGWEWDWGLCK